ncbi:hypothetical protein TWF730_009355 [Orbilia blumenaviensis]|uniref:FAD-binding PCMH-type domain-containing protein n=1 Tax=Orbilia blumenaviensis TaxID=1796055 RepID=A0AAV9V4L9_9PEZI
MASIGRALDADILTPIFDSEEQLQLLDQEYPELREAFEQIELEKETPPQFHDGFKYVKGRPSAPSTSWSAETVVRIVLKSLRDKHDDDGVFQRAYNLLDDTLKKKLDQFLAGSSIDDLFSDSEGFNPPTSQASKEKLLKLDDAVGKSTGAASKFISGPGGEIKASAAEHDKFSNWGQTVENTPNLTWAGVEKVADLCNIVKQAKASGQRVRVSGYRHSWSDIFSESGQILVSMLDISLVETLPNCTSLEADREYPGNEFKVIEFLGNNPKKPGKGLVKVGAAVTNEDFRRWAIKNNTWTLPINVIMVEITYGGSNAPICHGAGIGTQTLSDLVREVEYVDLNGNLCQVSDTEQLKAAAGCFGLLGVVTSITLEVDKMTYAQLDPKYKEILLAIPPPPNFTVPKDLQARYQELQKTPEVLEQALEEFKEIAEKRYYAEWFWFPTQSEIFINAWDNTDNEEGVIDYPSKFETFAQWLASWAGEVIQNSLFAGKTWITSKIFSPHVQAVLMSYMAMKTLPKTPVKTQLINGLHFRRGIQNMRVGDFEVEIPIPPTTANGTTRDWRVVQQAWWDGIAAMKADNNYSARIALEMRVTGDSDVLLAPQRGNSLGTASIEVITSMPAVNSSNPKGIWPDFKQSLADKWLTLKDSNGNTLNVRPHFAKEWRGTLANGVDWVKHLKENSMTQQIEDFKEALTKIGQEQPPGEQWTLDELQARFSTPLLDELIFA